MKGLPKKQTVAVIELIGVQARSGSTVGPGKQEMTVHNTDRARPHRGYLELRFPWRSERWEGYFPLVKLGVHLALDLKVGPHLLRNKPALLLPTAHRNGMIDLNVVSGLAIVREAVPRGPQGAHVAIECT